MTKRFVLVASTVLLLSSPAAAQRAESLDDVRVQSSINMFVAGPTGDSEEAQALRDRAKRIVYQTAAKECDILRETIAKDCRVQQINSSLNRQGGGRGSQSEGYQVTGNVTVVISLK